MLKFSLRHAQKAINQQGQFSGWKTKHKATDMFSFYHSRICSRTCAYRWPHFSSPSLTPAASMHNFLLVISLNSALLSFWPSDPPHPHLDFSNSFRVSGADGVVGGIGCAGGGNGGLSVSGSRAIDTWELSFESISLTHNPSFFQLKIPPQLNWVHLPVAA